jgi:hypothetical protein
LRLAEVTVLSVVIPALRAAVVPVGQRAHVGAALVDERLQRGRPGPGRDRLVRVQKRRVAVRDELAGRQLRRVDRMEHGARQVVLVVAGMPSFCVSVNSATQ